MIENIYFLYSQTKTKNFDNNCDSIQNEIHKLEIDHFFENDDKIFNRNLKNEEAAKQTEKDNIQKQYDLF